MHGNFCRLHKMLSQPYPTSPAMAAGVADHLVTACSIVDLIEAREARSTVESDCPCPPVEGQVLALATS